MDQNGYTDLHGLAEPRPYRKPIIALVLTLAAMGVMSGALAWRFAIGPLVAEWMSKSCDCAVDDFTLEHYPAKEPN